MRLRTVIKRALLASVAVSLGSAILSATPPVVMKVLVLAGSTNETSYQSINTYLDQIGVPHQTVALNRLSPDASGNRLSKVPLSDSATGRGLYQGIILTDSTFAACSSSCLSSADWTTLNTYASQFSVRVASYYTVPAQQWGLLPADSGALYTGSAPLNVTLTTEGAAVFSYLNSANPIAVGGQGSSGIRAYRATTTAAANETTTPLVVAGSYVVAATHTTPDGRETLALTMDNQPGLLHSQAFGYGVINWVTKGVFLGSRRVYFNPQNDDFLNGNWIYAPQSHPSCEFNNSCPTYFMTGPDLQAHANWQSSVRSDPQFQTYRMTFAINGVGTEWFDSSEPIFAAIKSLNSQFWWLSHTWDHANLDCYTVTSNGNCVFATKTQSLSELNKNITVASKLGITLDTQAMVTPFNSGLANPNFMEAAAQLGIKYIVFPEYPASPNTGIVNQYQPSILEVPRFNNNMFDDASSPYTGIAGSWPDEYNAKYGPSGNRTYSQNQTYSQILDHESQSFLQDYMLTYAPYMLAFHIANTATYDGVHSIYSDLMDKTIEKYKRLFTLPVLTLNTEDVGTLLKQRAGYDASGVVGVYTPGVSIVLTTTKAATIPVTGACAEATCVTYGGQIQDNVTMAANSSVTLMLNPTEGVTPSSVSVNPTSVVGGSASTGTLTLTAPAPSGGILVQLSSSNAAATVPGSVSITAGNTSATFTVNTTTVASDAIATITASYNGVSKTADLHVTPPAAALSSIGLNPTTVSGGTPSIGTITLTAPAPAGGASISLSSSSGSATVPASVTVTAGNTTATFNVNTSTGTNPVTATITATYNGGNKTASLTITPNSTLVLSSVTVSSSTVTSGTSITGTLTLTSAAPSGGVAVALTSSDPAAVVPASVTVPSGSTTAIFTVTTNYVAYWTGVVITGTYNGSTKQADLTVIPSASLSLVSVSANPTSIKGGTTATGTITLSTAAPAGGMPVEMWTTGAAAYVPFIVTVPAGSKTGTFTIQTIPVSSNTADVVVAFYNGTIQTAAVTVTP